MIFRSSYPSLSVLPSGSLPLGHPLPLDEHACSVSLPTWSSVVGYEEGLSEVTENLACGYPRFVYHPYVILLMEAALDMDKKQMGQHDCQFDCLVLPSKNSAMRCHDFLVKACGYFDGKACNTRLATQNFIGNSRVKLFSNDNSIDFDESFDGSYQDVYNSESPIRVLDLKVVNIHAVIFPAQTAFAIEAKSYWQHTGEVVSSRRAEVALTQLGLCVGTNGESDHKNKAQKDKVSFKRVTGKFIDKGEEHKTCSFTDEPYLALYNSDMNVHPGDNNDSFSEIKNRIASIANTSSSSIFLTPSGMASIYAAMRSARRRHIGHEKKQKCNDSVGGTSIVFGFPYLDTLKMCSRAELVPGGVEFFGHGDEKDLKKLEEMLKERSKNSTSGSAGISVLITEFPSNPLLNCPNLIKLRSLADEYDFALVIDDTVGNFANIDLIESGMADVVCTSLTKLFNGRGDAMAGSIVTNPNTKIGRWMKHDLSMNHVDNEGLWDADATAVCINSRDFLERSSTINETSEALAEWLNDREEISSVYYPKFTSPEGYHAVMKSNDYGGKHKAGYGGLISIVLNPHICQRAFYDKINLSKGPSLGTNFSLACPYTLLAHYHELDFAMSYDVEPNLIRFAIGLEKLDELKEKFDSAFKESKLHPKLTNVDISSNQFRGYCSASALYFVHESVKSKLPVSTHNCQGFISGGGLMPSLNKWIVKKRLLSANGNRRSPTECSVPFLNRNKRMVYRATRNVLLRMP